MDKAELIERVLYLFLAHGRERHAGAHEESVSALAHALQCAQLAEWAHAEPPLVAAALLHDIGHFLDGTPQPRPVDDAHEQLAASFLAQALGPAVVEPVRLHVQAKRYLVSTDSRYAGTLSPASPHSLALQGGPMSAAECRVFEALPHAQDALRLRRWDDAAQDPARRTPPLDYYFALLAEVAEPAQARTALGALDVS
jgi:phosphonate degradation associated HDIG domain protein